MSTRKTMAAFFCFIYIIASISIQTAVAKNVSIKEYVSSNLNKAMANPDWEFINFSPTNADRIMQKSEVTHNITFPYAWMQSVLKFDNIDIDGFREDDVIYETTDENVAYVITQGGARIYAKGVGTATITAKYKDLIQYFNVTVLNTLDEETLDSLKPSISVKTSGASNRTEIHNKAIAMKSVMWTPSQDLIQWCDSTKTYKYFPSGTLQFGLPYTQSSYRCDETFFLEMYQNAATTGFYNILSFTNRVGPKFGADCASFVAAAWGLWYNPISATQPTNQNSYYWVPSFINAIDDGTFTELNSYSELQTGDAVYISSHIFLITQNYETPPPGSSYTTSYVVAIEQTPPQTIYSFWTYNQLQSKGYVPFSKF